MRLAPVVALAVVLAGCTPQEEQVTPSPSPSASMVVAEATSAPEPAPEPTPAEQTGPPFTADTEIDTQEGSGNGLTVVDVRVDPQEGFDRVIFELEGTGTPGWQVIYVEEPPSPEDEEPIWVAGEAFLQVSLNDVGNASTAAERVSDPALGVVREVWLGAAFEGTYEAFIGLRDTVPFRVYGLDGPPRVVVEAVH